jgi:hypothetical protein
MITELVFYGSKVLVLPLWALMILAPGWKTTERILSSLWVVVPPALL